MNTNISLQQLRYIIEVVECGSINAASQNLYVSQPTLSTAIKETERELGISIFNRTNRGITLTNEGVEFVGYARQILEQLDLLEARYSNVSAASKGHLAISAQHYAFSVDAFIDLVEEYGEDEYDFALRETRTAEIIEDVKTYHSDLGILYISDFNSKVMNKTIADANLTFTPLFEAKPHVFVGTNHPLASKESINPEDLADYPRYSFEQGTNNSFFYAEEPFSQAPHKKNITFYDRGTLTNLLLNFNGYTLSTGVLSGEMNEGIAALPLNVDEVMTVGYIYHAERPLSPLALRYIEKLKARIEANPTVTKSLSGE